MRSLVVDCRMINNSGIGKYIKNVLPGLIQINSFDIVCLANENLNGFTWSSNIRIIKMKSKPFSLLEQFELPLKVPNCDIAWFPNWNVTFLPIRAKFIVVTVHDVLYLSLPELYPKMNRIISIAFLEMLSIRANKIITVSGYSKHEILKHIHIDADKIIPIHLGIDKNFKAKLTNKVCAENYILFVGNIKPHKNLRNAILAFSRLANKSFKFYIVGKKEGFITGCEDLLDMENFPNVRFFGEVSDDVLASLYLNAKLFFFPSKYEGFGLPILEAMVYNLPILASDIEVIREVAQDYIQYFDPNDIEDIVKKLDNFFKGKLLFNCANYADCLINYQWSNTIMKHNDVFNDVLK